MLLPVNRNVLEMARCLRFQAGLPNTFWGECIPTASYIINRLPTPILQNKTPFQALYNKPPNYSLLKTFGCLTFAYNPQHTSDKFNPRGVPCIFIGYPPHQKGYKILNLLTNQTFVSRDVKCYKHVFPYKLSKQNLSQLIPSSPDHTLAPCPIWEDSSSNEDDQPNSNNNPNPYPFAPVTATPVLRKSTRHSQPPSWMFDYVTNSAS